MCAISCDVAWGRPYLETDGVERAVSALEGYSCDNCSPYGAAAVTGENRGQHGLADCNVVGTALFAAGRFVRASASRSYQRVCSAGV